MFNKVILIGYLGADPEIRTTSDGRPVARFRIATSERWKDKTGEPREHTEWHTVVCFNAGLCRVIERYLKKGSKVLVEGKIQTRSYEKDGGTRYSTEIVLSQFDSRLLMLDTAEKGDRPAPSPDDYGEQKARGPYYPDPQGVRDRYGDDALDDEIPF